MTTSSKITPINFTSQSNRSLHVAIIMDGNGRWAARRNQPRVFGHRAGASATRSVIERASDLGLACLTLYAFSSDNWRRPIFEVDRIFWLLRAYLRKEASNLRDRDARLQIIGRRDRLPLPLLREISRAESITAQGSGLHLRVAIDYSSRDSIARAASLAFRSGLQSTSSAQIARRIDRELTGECGPVDLLIRTGGEQRLSDFLLWEAAYAELYFTPRMWPDFTGDDLESALHNFHHRERRFGALQTIPQEPSSSPSKYPVPLTGATQ
ncbi:polyprenyl diphosphate synthase [Acidicapsa dinghuensis]|uniref:Isoprenyl transferase n=1 Tax=Acidicapsa dinghuensis TaxID=2218256 RepID=A0ABW1EM34_9BACT|nr:polyprenyl diphosphate synthase [Acidicapsa dinghuensis]